jgi:hypothetical protein
MLVLVLAHSKGGQHEHETAIYWIHIHIYIYIEKAQWARGGPCHRSTTKLWIKTKHDIFLGHEQHLRCVE